MTKKQDRPGRGRTGAVKAQSSADGSTPDYTKTPRPLPPFGRDVIARQRKKESPGTVYIFAGQDAWQRAKGRIAAYGDGTALVLPFGEDPETYRWPIMDGCIVDAHGRSAKEAARIARTICSDGSRYCCAVWRGGSLHCWHQGAERAEAVP